MKFHPAMRSALLTLSLVMPALQTGCSENTDSATASRADAATELLARYNEKQELRSHVRQGIDLISEVSNKHIQFHAAKGPKERELIRVAIDSDATSLGVYVDRITGIISSFTPEQRSVFLNEVNQYRRDLSEQLAHLEARLADIQSGGVSTASEKTLLETQIREATLLGCLFLGLQRLGEEGKCPDLKAVLKSGIKAIPGERKL
jgi:hypothetical protein